MPRNFAVMVTRAAVDGTIHVGMCAGPAHVRHETREMSPPCTRDCDSAAALSGRCRGTCGNSPRWAGRSAARLRSTLSTSMHKTSRFMARHYGGTLTKGLPRSRKRSRRCWSRDSPMRVLTCSGGRAPPRSSHSRSLVHRSVPDSSRPMPSAAQTRPGPRARSASAHRRAVASHGLESFDGLQCADQHRRAHSRGLPRRGSASGRCHTPCARRRCRARRTAARCW